MSTGHAVAYCHMGMSPYARISTPRTALRSFTHDRNETYYNGRGLSTVSERHINMRAAEMCAIDTYGWGLPETCLPNGQA